MSNGELEYEIFDDARKVVDFMNSGGYKEVVSICNEPRWGDGRLIVFYKGIPIDARDEYDSDSFTY